MEMTDEFSCRKRVSDPGFVRPFGNELVHPKAYKSVGGGL